jgi:hypothetical protein
MSQGSSRAGASGPAVCTIIAKNYLAYARALVKSLRRFHPDLTVYVLFVDDTAGFVDPAQEDFTLLGLDVLDLPRRQEFLFRYDVMELSTAVKPYPASRGSSIAGHGKVLYLDPTSGSSAPLDDLFAWLEKRGRAPHPAPHGSPRRREVTPTSATSCSPGPTTSGFMGSPARAQVEAACSPWWADRCEFLLRLRHHPRHVRGPAVDGPDPGAGGPRAHRPAIPGTTWPTGTSSTALSGGPSALAATARPVPSTTGAASTPCKPTALSKHQNPLSA